MAAVEDAGMEFINEVPQMLAAADVCLERCKSECATN